MNLFTKKQSIKLELIASITYLQWKLALGKLWTSLFWDFLQFTLRQEKEVALSLHTNVSLIQ